MNKVCVCVTVFVNQAKRSHNEKEYQLVELSWKKIHGEFCLIELMLSIDLEYVIPINISFTRLKNITLKYFITVN